MLVLYSSMIVQQPPEDHTQTTRTVDVDVIWVGTGRQGVLADTHTAATAPHPVMVGRQLDNSMTTNLSYVRVPQVYLHKSNQTAMLLQKSVSVSCRWPVDDGIKLESLEKYTDFVFT